MQLSGGSVCATETDCISNTGLWLRLFAGMIVTYGEFPFLRPLERSQRLPAFERPSLARSYPCGGLRDLWRIALVGQSDFRRVDKGLMLKALGEVERVG